MTGFDSKRRIALDRLDDDDIQVYAQPEGKIMTEEEARTLEAMKYAASMGYPSSMLKDMFAPFTITRDVAMAQPAQAPTTRVWMECSALAAAIHYPDCWDVAAYPELDDALNELAAWSKAAGCSTCTPPASQQEEKEPYGYMSECGIFQKEKPEIGRWETLYITPAQRPWVGLTDENIFDIAIQIGIDVTSDNEDSIYIFCKAIQAALKEKNNG